MKTVVFYLLIVSAFFSACSSAKRTINPNFAASIAVLDGSSYEKAIIIHQDHETPGIHDEYAWIMENYPGYKNRGQSLSNYKNKPYDIIHITTADGKNLDIYFDISHFFGKF